MMRHAGSQADTAPEPTGEDFKKAVSVLLPYLLSHRTRLASLEDSSSGTKHSAETVRPCDSLHLNDARADAPRRTAHKNDVAAPRHFPCIGSVWHTSTVHGRDLLNGCRLASSLLPALAVV